MTSTADRLFHKVYITRFVKHW